MVLIPTGLALGSALTAAGIAISLIFPAHDRRGLDGLTLSVIGVVVITAAVLHRTVTQVNRPADEAFNEGLAVGYDKGYAEGHHDARAVVVQLRGGDERRHSAV